MHDPDETEEGCGTTWDHTLILIAESRDGYRTFECEECGAGLDETPSEET